MTDYNNVNNQSIEDYTTILNRQVEEQVLETILTNFAKLSHEEKLSAKKGIYIYGPPGVGKSFFVKKVLNKMNYEIIHCNTGIVRNKELFDQISSHNMSNYSVISLLKRKPQNIAIVMDDINSMNNGDKGALTALIKIIRAKKTKKHKSEDTSMNPIICIGTGITGVGKKITELIKACHVLELKKPTTEQIERILRNTFSSLDTGKHQHSNEETARLSFYIENDLHKLKIISNLYANNPDILNNNVFQDIFYLKSHNDENKIVVKEIFNATPSIEQHLTTISETERTTVGLFWHENVADVLENIKSLTPSERLVIYLHILNNICFADYMDRITFQKQIWKFNEMSSLIKNFKTQYILKSSLDRLENKHNNGNKNISCILYPWNKSSVRFTKILTKYSNEFNNYTFIQTLCEKLGLDVKDIYAFFMQLKIKSPNTQTNSVADLNPLNGFNISCMDIKRVYKYTNLFCFKKLDLVLKNVVLDDDDECDFGADDEMENDEE